MPHPSGTARFQISVARHPHVAEGQEDVPVHMVDGAAEFAAALRDAGLRDAIHVPFEGEDHTTVVVAAMMRGLVIAFPAPA